MNLNRLADLAAGLAFLALLALFLYHGLRKPLQLKQLRGLTPLAIAFLLIQATNRLLEMSTFDHPVAWVLVPVKLLSAALLWALLVHLARTVPVALKDGVLQQTLTERDALQVELNLLKEREARYSGIVSSAMDAIISLDSQQRITVFNAAAEAMFRCRASEVLGQPLDRFIPARYRQAHHGYVQEYGDHGQTDRSMRSPGVLTGLRSDGTEFPMEATISHVWVNGERAYSAVVRDISARVQMEAELSRRGEELASRDRSNSEWLAMLAHELRNPLAPILNAVAILRSLGEGNLETRLKQKSLIERQVRHLSRLVEDLLDVSRMTRGMIGMEKRPTVLGESVLAAIEATRSQIEGKSQTLHFSPTEEAFVVAADPVRLEQVAVNLLTNASKYTHPGGEIWVNLDRVEEDWVTVTVRDSGIGIPADLIGKVFDLFHQEDRSLDRTQGGLGIGLTLVKAIVEKHGGRVEVYSAGRNQGSEFQVWLPSLAAAMLPPVNGQHAADERGPVCRPLPAPPQDRQAVLIVDDNDDSANTLADLCDLWGFKADIATTGWKALERLRERGYATVLLDIGLPGMDGYEVCRRLRSLKQQPDCLIALTGYGSEADRAKAREAGFDGHLVKPVDPNRLRRILEGDRPVWEPVKTLV